MPVGYERTTQGAYPAVKATLTKEVYVDGKLTESTLLYTDSYSGAQRKAVRGTRQPVTTTKAPETKPSDGSSSSAATKAETTKASEPSDAPETTKAPETKPTEATKAETKAETKAPEQSKAESSPAE